MTEEEFLQILVQGILPQREPFIMISHLLHYDDLVTTTRFTIEASNVFCREGRLVASGLIENIAQTCAARIGYINKYILHKDVNIGFIGAVRNLQIHELPPVGSTIETRIEVLSSTFGITLAHGDVRLLDGTLIAEGEMKIALSEKNRISIVIVKIADNIVSPLGMTTAENVQAVRQYRSALSLYEQWQIPEPFMASLFDQGQVPEATYEGVLRLSIAEALRQLGSKASPAVAQRTLLLLSSTKGQTTGQHGEPMGITAQRLASHFGISSLPITVSNACISGLSLPKY